MENRQNANINWYPGHMKKTRELIEANLKAVDVAVEVVDARIPVSSRNPIIDSLLGGKRRIIVLNKSDLADPAETSRWRERLTAEGNDVIEADCMRGRGIKELLRLLEKIQDERNAQRAVKRPLRLMIVGIPNVGKSSLINRLTGKKSTKTGNKPGVTRGKQWVSIAGGMQLLDTPGLLWPKFEDPSVGLDLAFCGSIRDEVLSTEDLALELIKALRPEYGHMLTERYKLDGLAETALEDMEAIAEKRGFILSGKRTDYERCGRTLLDEFRSGAIGRITLERCTR